MGLFSSKKKVSVASTCYNLAGDEADRPQYLRGLVLRNILSGTSDTLGDTLIAGYLGGPGIKLRTFFRWADEYGGALPGEGGFDLIGMPEGSMVSTISMSTSVVAPHVPLGSAAALWVQYVETGPADFGVWAEKHLLENAPADIDTDWEADISETGNVITINRVSGPDLVFTATDFDKNADYIYVYYNEIAGENIEPREDGDEVILGTDPFADTTGWTLEDTITTSEDTGPPNSLPYSKVVREYYRETYMGAHPTIAGALYSIREWRTDTHDQVEIAGPALEDYRTTVTDTQEVIHSELGGLKVFIYRIGSGNADLDALVEKTEDYGKFYPPIPVRIDNVFLSEADYPDEYAVAKKAYKKAINGDYDELIEKLADNESLGDIDYAYVVFGVSLNVIEDACKEYIWAFFEYMRTIQAGGPSLVNDFTSNYEAYGEVMTEWREWFAAQSTPSDPLYGTPEPIRPDKLAFPTNELKINNVGTGTSNMNYNVSMVWSHVKDTEVRSGLGRPGAKNGDYWFTVEQDDTLLSQVYATTRYVGGGGDSDPIAVTELDENKVQTVRLHWQVNQTEYRYIDIIGFVHRNYIYDGKYVEITAVDALADGEESGFIIPLHNGTYRQLPLVVTTQMATACVFMVLNSYKVTKVRWYQRGIFRILLVILFVVAAVVLTGGSAAGLVFGSVSVATSGLSAAIFAGVVNALAAMVLVTIIETAATAIFGEQFGAIIGAIVGIIAMTSLVPGNPTFQWGDLLKADNLLKLTNAVSSGYMSYVNSRIAGMAAELEQITAENDQQRRSILEKQYAEFGFSGQLIDPMMLIDMPSVDGNTRNGFYVRSRQDFLDQTLLLGSDIVETSQTLLYDFVDLSLRLPEVDEAT